MTTFSFDLSQAPIPLQHVWEHTVGSDHAPITLRADWQSQMRTCRTELGFRHVRFHGMLSDAMGTLICHREELLYSFFNIDQVFDFLLSIGVRPFVELSFMPETLASGSHTVFRYQGNVTPPKDYGEWAMLIRKLVQHWVDRYGLAEVRQWYFEVWNEPNLVHFWTGTQQQYFTLYRHTVEAIKGVDPSLRVGGPATAQSAWVAEFVAFCETHDLPADFVTTHYYPTDAFGEIGADTVTQLANAPRDVMRDRAREARRDAGGRPLYYTEWNVSSNPRDLLHDQPFAAAYATRIIMNIASEVQGYSFWTLSDIFAENYFPSVPFHGGFGLLNLHGIPKPVYRAFELLHHLGSELHPTAQSPRGGGPGLVPVSGAHETLDAWLVRNGGDATILITNHAQPRQPIATELLTLVVSNAARPPRAIYLERIDERHSNPFAAWQDMGEPAYLSAAAVDQLKAASRMVKQPIEAAHADGRLTLRLDVPPHAVAAITMEGLLEA